MSSVAWLFVIALVCDSAVNNTKYSAISSTLSSPSIVSELMVSTGRGDALVEVAELVVG
jgi:hypothetical protein